MKTTLDLPERLIRELELRAQQTGQDLQQAAAEVLQIGLGASPPTTALPQRATVRTHANTGLPYIQCAHAAPPAAEMTPDRVAEVLLEQEATWYDEAGR